VLGAADTHAEEKSLREPSPRLARWTQNSVSQGLGITQEQRRRGLEKNGSDYIAFHVTKKKKRLGRLGGDVDCWLSFPTVPQRLPSQGIGRKPATGAIRLRKPDGARHAVSFGK